MTRAKCPKIIRSQRTPAKSESSSSQQSSDSEDTSSGDAAWIKSTIGQLTTLKDFVSKAATTIDGLLSMLKSASDLPGSALATSSVSTMTQTDEVTGNRSPHLCGEASVSRFGTNSEMDSPLNSVKIQSLKSPSMRHVYRPWDCYGKDQPEVRGTRRYIELFVTRVHHSTAFRNLENYIAQYVTDFSLEKISHA